MTIKKRLINKLKPYQGWTVVFLSLSTALLTILVYSVEDWNPNYAPVFWYLFLLPVSLTAYIYGLGVGLGLSTLSTALFVPIVAKHLNAQGLSPLVVNLVMAILILNGAAILIGYFGWSHRRQRDLYRTLNLLGERFSQELQLEELLEVVLEQAMAELDANAGEILLWDESSAELIVAASRGSNELTSKTTSPPTEKSLGLWLLEQNQPYLNNALLEDPCLTHTTTFGVDLPNSLICTPLRRGRHPFGLLCLFDKASGNFVRRDLEMLVAIANKSEVAIENARLYQQTDATLARRVEELASIAEIDRQLSASLELQNIINLVLDNAIEKTKATAGLVGLANKDVTHLNILALQGYPPDAILHDIHSSWSIQEGIIGRVVRTGISALASNVHQDPDYFEGMPGIQSQLTVPIIHNERVIGVLNLESTRLDSFEQDALHFVKHLADHAAIAITNARLFEEERRRVEEMSGLYEIALNASSTLDLNELLGQTMARVVQLLEAEKGTMLLHDASQGMLIAQPAASFGTTREISRFRIRTDTDNFATSVFVTGQSFISDNVEFDKRLIPAYRPFVSIFGAKSVLGVPLRGSEGNIGELYLINKLTGSFTANDDRLLGTVASQLAVAIEKARLYEQTDESLRTRVEELTALRQISAEMNATLELQHILNLLLEQALKTTEAQHGNVMLLDAESQRFQMQATRGYQKNEIKQMESLLLDNALYETPFIQQLLDEKTPFIIPDTTRETMPVCASTSVRSTLTIPILHRGQTVGIINLGSPSVDHFTDDHTRFIQALALQAALAIGNAQTYQEQFRQSNLLRQRTEQLDSLLAIARVQRADLPLKDVLEEIAYGISNAIGFKMVLVSVTEKTNQDTQPVLHRIAMAGLPMTTFAEMKKTRLPLVNVERIMRPEYQISQSYFFPFEKEADWGRELHSFISTPAERIEGWTKEKWHPRDAMMVPLHSTAGQLMGIITVDQPLDGKRPTLFVAESLEIFAYQAAAALENNRIYAQARQDALRLEQRTRNLALIQSISTVANSSLDLGTILSTVANRLVKAFDIDHCGIVLLNPEQTEGRVAAEYPALGSYNMMVPIVGYPAAEQILATKSPIAITDVLNNELVASLRESLKQMGTQSILIVPLLTGDTVIGTIGLDSIKSKREFTAEEINLCQTIANQIATAVENARLFEAEKERRQIADALAEVSRVLGEAIDLSEILDLALEQLGKVVNCDSCSILMLEDNSLRVVAGQGLPNLEQAKQNRISVENIAVAKRVVGNREPLVIPDTRQNTLWQSQDEYGRQIKSWIAAPLVARGEIFGALAVDSLTPGTYGPADAEKVAAFAQQIAVAIENARLFSAEQERRKLADTLREVAETVSATLDLQQVLEIILDRLGLMVEYDSATIQLLTGDHLEVIAARGHEEPERVLGLIFSLDEGRPNREAILSRKPCIIGDISERYEIFRVATHPRFRSWMGIPLYFHDQPVGLITLDKQTSNFYGERDAQHASLFATQAAVAIQNARLFEETNRHVAELDVLLKTGQQIVASLEMDTMLRTIVTHAIHLVKASCGWILLLSSENKIVTHWTSHGLNEQKLTGLNYDLVKEGLEGWVIRERTPALSRALLDDERVTGRARQLMAELNLESATLVPLMLKEQVIGVLTVAKEQDNRPLMQHELDLLTVMASQAAVALENAQLFAERERNIAELSIMYQTSRAISASLDLEAIVEMIYTQVSQIMDATNFYIAFYDKETNQVSFPLFIKNNESHQEPPRQGEHGLTEYIMEHKRPLLLPSKVRAYLNSLGIQAIGTEAHSWLGVPMIAGDQVLGVICVQSYEREYVYDQNHLSLLSTIAAQAAVAVRNAQLFQQVQDLVKEMEERVEKRTEELVKAVSDLMMERDRVQTLYRITSDLAASLDVDRVLNRSLSLICEAIGAPQASILLMDSESEYLVHRSALRREKPLPRGGVKTKYREGVGLAGWVMETQEPTIVPDVTKDERWLFEKDEPRESKAVMAVPLLLGDSVQGVLLLFHPRTDYFTTDHLQLLMTIGHQLASAINNADLFTLVQESATRLGKLARANQAETAKSQAILEAIADGVMVTDAEGRIILFNAAASRILGIASQSVLKRNIKDMSGLYGAKSSPWAALSDGWQPHQIDKDTTFIAEQLEIENRIVSVRLAPVHVEEEFLGTVSVFRDVTHDEKVARMKSEFVSIVSHELRTPMTSIKGFVDLLLVGAAGNISDRQRHFLSIIKSNVDRLATLVGDLLDLSRIETGRVRLQLERIYFTEVIQTVLDSLHTKIEEKGLELITEIPDSVPIITGDRNRLIQILTNLIANAYQYTPTGGQIRIQVTCQDDLIKVTVTDTGIGISEEDQLKIYDRFFRADHPVVQDSGGTGLGLPIVKSLIELHGGELQLHSTPGEGSEFSFTLPLNSLKETLTDI